MSGAHNRNSSRRRWVGWLMLALWVAFVVLVPAHAAGLIGHDRGGPDSGGGHGPSDCSFCALSAPSPNHVTPAALLLCVAPLPRRRACARVDAAPLHGPSPHAPRGPPQRG